MSTRIGRYVKYALESEGGLCEAVGGRIYHVIAPDDDEEQFPYIVFASDGFDEEETKDGLYGDRVSVEISVMARTAENMEDVANLVRKAMSNAPESWNETESPVFQINEQTLRVGQELYDLAHDCFFLTMNYIIDTEL